LLVAFLRARIERKRHMKKTTSIKAKSAPSSVQSGVETRKIGTFTPDSRNANKGTERG
jgi:hypothetical protein